MSHHFTATENHQSLLLLYIGNHKNKLEQLKSHYIIIYTKWEQWNKNSNINNTEYYNLINSLHMLIYNIYQEFITLEQFIKNNHHIQFNNNQQIQFQQFQTYYNEFSRENAQFIKVARDLHQQQNQNNNNTQKSPQLLVNTNNNNKLSQSPTIGIKRKRDNDEIDPNKLKKHKTQEIKASIEIIKSTFFNDEEDEKQLNNYNQVLNNNSDDYKELPKDIKRLICEFAIGENTKCDKCDANICVINSGYEFGNSQYLSYEDKFDNWMCGECWKWICPKHSDDRSRCWKCNWYFCEDCDFMMKCRVCGDELCQVCLHHVDDELCEGCFVPSDEDEDEDEDL